MYPGDYLIDRPYTYALCLLFCSFAYSHAMFFDVHDFVMHQYTERFKSTVPAFKYTVSYYSSRSCLD